MEETTGCAAATQAGVQWVVPQQGLCSSGLAGRGVAGVGHGDLRAGGASLLVLPCTVSQHRIQEKLRFISLGSCTNCKFVIGQMNRKSVWKRNEMNAFILNAKFETICLPPVLLLNFFMIYNCTVQIFCSSHFAIIH